LAVFVGEIHGGNRAAAVVGDEAGGAADSAVGVEYSCLACDFDQVYQLAGGSW